MTHPTDPSPREANTKLASHAEWKHVLGLALVCHRGAGRAGGQDLIFCVPTGGEQEPGEGNVLSCPVPQEARERSETSSMFTKGRGRSMRGYKCSLS